MTIDRRASVRAGLAAGAARGVLDGIRAAKNFAPAEANVGQYLNSTGRAAMTASHDDCLLDAMVRHPFGNRARSS